MISFRYASATLPLAISFRYAISFHSIPFHSIHFIPFHSFHSIPLRFRSRFHSIINACIHTLYSPALRYFRNSPETINLQEFVRVYETSLPSSITAEGPDVVA